MSTDRPVVTGTESQLKDIAEARLTREYGEARNNISPGLRWLTGDPHHIPLYLDHPEYRIKDGERTVNANPYGLDLEDLESLVKLAKSKKLYLYIEPISNYNTGTVLVVLTETSSSVQNQRAARLRSQESEAPQ